MAPPRTEEELRAKLSEIEQRGFVESLRGGPTGIGKTLETLLGIIENPSRQKKLAELAVKTWPLSHK